MSVSTLGLFSLNWCYWDGKNSVSTVVLSLTFLLLMRYAYDTWRIADCNLKQFRALSIKVYLLEFGKRLAGAKRDVKKAINNEDMIEPWTVHKEDILRYFGILLKLWPSDNKKDKEFLDDKRKDFERICSKISPESECRTSLSECETFLVTLSDDLEVMVALLL